ncbi:hypothetical protein HDU99_010915, partial [Rhizoclosmatium hyalinum]
MMSFLKRFVAGVNGMYDTKTSAPGETGAAEEPVVLKLSELQINDYNLKVVLVLVVLLTALPTMSTMPQPLDAVLFAGADPVANFIKKIELHEVVPRLDTPFHELWTHAGILVDKSVLPLDCLEEGKLYLYESVFSGEVAGYVYSKVLPVDHPTKPGSFHLGPQIRDFAAVVKEGDSDVGICPLTPEERAFMEARLKENPTLLLDLYNKYHEFGYPITNLLPVVASASQSLYKDLEIFSNVTK